MQAAKGESPRDKRQCYVPCKLQYTDSPCLRLGAGRSNLVRCIIVPGRHGVRWQRPHARDCPASYVTWHAMYPSMQSDGKKDRESLGRGKISPQGKDPATEKHTCTARCPQDIHAASCLGRTPWRCRARLQAQPPGVARMDLRGPSMMASEKRRVRKKERIVAGTSYIIVQRRGPQAQRTRGKKVGTGCGQGARGNETPRTALLFWHLLLNAWVRSREEEEDKWQVSARRAVRS